MELYEEAFKLQEMIESDMRAELSPSGGDLRCGMDDSLDAFEPPSVWSTGISLISELDGLEGLLVDPQTGLPSHHRSSNGSEHAATECHARGCHHGCSNRCVDVRCSNRAEHFRVLGDFVLDRQSVTSKK
ncbi:hypothetical protein HPB51_010626 [Rhipicephalus microplus]|uniref:Uncharacterized protein n=1 Tax=Rhipicephalus microplus TaxID=6941 RepID=A0A9J6ENA1_RHIMP|nr:hypothetical protein HPB51_010626 [Rhipicephalus microplus]